MTNIVKDTAAKLSVAIVAVAMVFSAFAASASAQTTEELQQMINDLLAQIAQLEASTDVSAGTGACVSIMAPLTIGSQGADVTALQNRLLADGESIPAGATGYFGSQTQAALASWQAKNGVAPAVGYYGPITKAAMDASCTPADDMDDDMDDDDMMDDDDDMELSGEASLDSFELDSEESSIEEGDTDVVIGNMMIEFTDGDAEISRIDVAFDADSGNDEDEPWEVFETVSLWVDGDMIAEIDADDEDEYLDEDAGELRFTGLDLIAEEDEEIEVLVAVTVQNNLDGVSSSDDETWTLTVESMRFFDADGVATTENDPAGSDSVDFDIEEEGADEEFDVSLSSSNPDGTDIVVDTDTDTNGVTILVADLEAEDNDMEIDTVVVRVDTTNGTTTDIVDEIYVVIDGEEFDAENISGSGLAAGDSQQISTTSVWYLFDIDGDVVVDDGDEVEMEVVVDFNDTDDGARYPNGALIQARITSTELAEWDVEGDNDVAADGSAVGDEHTLVAEGILVPSDGFSSDIETLGQNDTIGEFTLEFDVTAVEDDFYITENASLASTSPTDGVAFSYTGNVGTGTVTGTLTSTADEDTAGVFTVRDGETETFTLTVSIDPQNTGIFRVSLAEVIFSASTDGVTSPQTYTPLPVSDFRSNTQTIQGS